MFIIAMKKYILFALTLIFFDLSGAFDMPPM